jgi:TorA maturation chaperone TorD
MDADAGKAGMADTDSGAIAPEDSGRLGFYAIIGRLFFAPPNADLIAQIAAHGNSADTAQADAEGGLTPAWRGLQSACQTCAPETIRHEHERLFIGLGKAQITPFTAAYLKHIAPDRHLVQLRQQLQDWGLARQGMVFDSEDHISGLCDIMRILIEKKQTLELQRQFFEEYVLTGGVPFCDAIIGTGGSVFYGQVARFAKAFFELEKAAFEMLVSG